MHRVRLMLFFNKETSDHKHIKMKNTSKRMLMVSACGCLGNHTELCISLLPSYIIRIWSITSNSLKSSLFYEVLNGRGDYFQLPGDINIFFYVFLIFLVTVNFFTSLTRRCKKERFPFNREICIFVPFRDK